MAYFLHIGGMVLCHCVCRCSWQPRWVRRWRKTTAAAAYRSDEVDHAAAVTDGDVERHAEIWRRVLVGGEVDSVNMPNKALDTSPSMESLRTCRAVQMGGNGSVADLLWKNKAPVEGQCQVAVPLRDGMDWAL